MLLHRLGLALCMVFPANVAAGQDRTAASGLPPRADQGARWYEIVRTRHVVAYLDTARVERPTAGVARIWFRFAYATPMSIGPETRIEYGASEAREELDCANRRAKDLELRMETTNGVSTAAPAPPQEWRSIDTHPLNSGVFLVACRFLGTPIAPKPGV
jgi:hypothetical protein